MTKKDNVISLFGSNRSLIKSPPLKTKNFCLLNSPPTLFCTKTAGLASRARGEGEGRKKKKLRLDSAVVPDESTCVYVVTTFLIDVEGHSGGK